MTWTNKNNQLSKRFTFSNFLEALDFTNKVGDLAEKIGHHPTITLTWGEVTITTTTHDEGNTLTDKDFELTKEIDNL